MTTSRRIRKAQPKRSSASHAIRGGTEVYESIPGFTLLMCVAFGSLVLFIAFVVAFFVVAAFLAAVRGHADVLVVAVPIAALLVFLVGLSLRASIRR